MLEFNEVEPCKMNIKYSADPDKVREKREEIVSYYRKQSVPGFRAGKAPSDVLKFHFKSHIDNGLKHEMAQVAFDEAVQERNLRAFGNPQFTDLSLKDDNFNCSFLLHTVPEFELKKYKEFEIPKGSLPDPTEMGEMILQNLRNQFGETLPYGEEDYVQEGDGVICNIKGFDENRVELFSKEGELFNIGTAPFKALNENLLGMKMGETREFSCVVEEDGDLKDKNILFKVELVMGSKSNPHPINDELAKKMNVETVDDLKSLTQSAAANRVKILENRHIFEQISSRIIEGHNFAVPDWLSSAEAQTMARQQNLDWDALSDQDKEKLIKSGADSVRLALVLDKIRQEEPDAQLTEEETVQLLRAKVREQQPNASEEEVFQELVNSGQIKLLLTAVKDEHTIDFIVKNSSIVE